MLSSMSFTRERAQRAQIGAISVCYVTLLFISRQQANANFGPAFHPDPYFRARQRPELNWNWGHQLSGISVNNQRVPNILSHVLDYNFTLPRIQLQRGLTYFGSACRLRKVVLDLLNHRDAKIGVVGGSVSWGTGATRRGVTDWFSIFSSYMINAFPGANITARNGCTPGVGSPYMIMCLELSVDMDVDLIFVEYTLNDGHDERLYDHKVVINIERLVRRLLALPKRPAVVLVHHPSHYQFTYQRDHPKSGDAFTEFYKTSEDAQGSISQYYDVQSLSLRTAVYRLAAFLEQPGFLWEDIMADHHPGDHGHKIMADLAVYLVQQTALGLLINPYVADDEKAVNEPLPRPMYKGNFPPNSPMCIMYERLSDLIVHNQGWSYINEGTDEKPKPGFVATQPGSVMRLRLNTDRANITAGGGDAAGGEESVHVFFHHLRSYEHMGVANFSCLSGCTCQDVVVDAHITEQHSQLYLMEMAVSQSKECVVQVEVLPRSSSGGEHKFKLAGVVLSDRPGRPIGISSLGGHNEVFGLRQHTGDEPQMLISKEGIKGVITAATHRQRRRRLHGQQSLIRHGRRRS